MKTIKIKGICEYCGLRHTGHISAAGLIQLGEVKCPDCGKNTQNFEEEYYVDQLNKSEGERLEYALVDYEEQT